LGFLAIWIIPLVFTLNQRAVGSAPTRPTKFPAACVALGPDGSVHSTPPRLKAESAALDLPFKSVEPRALTLKAVIDILRLSATKQEEEVGLICPVLVED
jgi:hypothetical protein